MPKISDLPIAAADFDADDDIVGLSGGVTSRFRQDRLFAAVQPVDATLTALAGLSATAGLVEQTGAEAFAKRSIGAAAATDVPTRADGDARWAQLNAANTLAALQTLSLGAASDAGDAAGAMLPSTGIPFGPTADNWKARTRLTSSGAATHVSDSRATLAVGRESSGSGQNGPASADFAVFFWSVKTDFLNNTDPGEVDGGYSIVRQGINGDTSGFMVDSQKRSGGNGGATGFEAQLSWVDGTGTKTSTLKTTTNFLEGSGGATQGQGCSYYTEARAGTFYAPFMGIGRSDLAGAPAFSHLLVGQTSRAAADRYFSIHGTGKAYFGSPASQTVVRHDATLNRFEILNAAETVVAFSVDQAGVAIAAGSLRAPVGAEAAPSFNFSGDSNTGLWSPGADVLAISTGGVERARFNSVGDFKMGGGASSVTVIDGDRVFRKRSYTKATLPSASAKGAGADLYVSDEIGGATPAFSDGTNWRRVSDLAVVS